MPPSPKKIDQPIPTSEMTQMARKDRYYYATGKRKTAVAQVRLYPKGKGDFLVNNRRLEDYFFGILIGSALYPLKLSNLQKNVDVTVEVSGGGIHAQADAVRHGLTRALVDYDAGLKAVLKKAALLTRDARVKERKKYGLKRARRAPQWAKR